MVNLLWDDHVASSKGLVDFIDQASPEEKATFGWMEDRAVAQYIYELRRSKMNLPPDPQGQVKTGDEKVDGLIQKLVKEMLANYSRSLDEAMGLEDSDAYAQVKKDFGQLLASGHGFTFT